MNTNELYLSRCLQLAALGGGYVAPNPMVGAVLVCDGKIIGEGYHQRYGEPHAEPNAIKNAVDTHCNTSLQNATLYVNLEPCAHYGKTPPCAELITRCKIPKVVVGTLDPNPKVAGRGIEILQNAGIEVITGVLEKECRELNKRFFTFIEKKRPYIVLKWAQAADGFIDKQRTDSSEPPLQISNTLTKQLTHKIRTENQGIMAGTNTILLDNPYLTARRWQGQNPVRLVLDSHRRIPENYHIFDGSVPTLIFTDHPPQNGKNAVKYLYFNFNKCTINDLITIIYEQNIHSVLVEGGAQLLGSFIENGVWDLAHVEIAPFTIGNGVPAPVLPLMPIKETKIQKHRILEFENRNT